MKKYKYLLFFAFFIVFLFLGANYAFALEVDLGLGPNPTLAQYVAFIFSWLIGIAGVLSLISFAIGAIGLINPNVEAHGEAKSRMISAVLGLVLTLASFIIINTINPVLTTPTLTQMIGVSGAFYTNGDATLDKPCPKQNSDTSAIPLMPVPYNAIKYVCNDNSKLLVWVFPKTGLEAGNDLNDPLIHVWELKCGDVAPIVFPGSFKLLPETPGVYYFLGANCTGYMSGPNTVSQNNIGAFSGSMGGVSNLKGIKIVNDVDNDTEFGVIFHKVADLKNAGICNRPITQGSDLSDASPLTNAPCNQLLIDAAAADIFEINYYGGGNGIDFYSEPHDKGGLKTLSDEEITDKISSGVASFLPDSTDLTFDWSLTTEPEEYQKSHKTFKDSPGSIKIKGDYLVALYAGIGYCQTFNRNQDVADLTVEPIIGPGIGNLIKIYIFPTW